MKRYRVRYLTEATEALRAAFLHVYEDAGPRRAAMAVHFIDFVHTARKTKLDDYTG